MIRAQVRRWCELRHERRHQLPRDSGERLGLHFELSGLTLPNNALRDACVRDAGRGAVVVSRRPLIYGTGHLYIPL
jgi:hypothetical protein